MRKNHQANDAETAQINPITRCTLFLYDSGFLNLGIKECPGNQGIKDIILSLRWIQENIQYFGGDPENITLLGSSSGAAIIHILMLSPLTKGTYLWIKHLMKKLEFYGINFILSNKFRLIS